jgi:serine protease inhibitor
MKIVVKKILPLLSLVALAACNDTVTPDNEVRAVSIPLAVSTGTTSFALDFWKQLQVTQPTEDNLFVSPLSLHMALGMLLNGAENQTAQEILKTLKMEGVTIEELNTAYYTLINELPKADSRVKLGLANSMWYRKGFAVESNFQDVLKKSFQAEVKGLEFNDTAKDMINQWASDKTAGKIKKVIDEVKPEHVMFLLNALYFKGDWATQFDSKNTVDTPFKLHNGGEKQVKMMFTVADLKMASTSEYSAVQLPYANGQFNMTIIVPKEEHNVAEITSGFSQEKWNALQTSSLASRKVRIGLPRFSLDYSVKLNATLDKMGISKVFTDAAELGKISKAANLKVDFVKQDAYLNIDEKGSEAAAVTSIGIVLTSLPSVSEVICDRPFLLIISEKTSNTILFMGRIMNPDSK